MTTRTTRRDGNTVSGSHARSRIAVRAFAVWLILMAVESVHGALRTLLIAPYLGDFRARQVGVFVGSLLLFGIAYLFVKWIGATSVSSLLLIGVAWAALTLAFEVELGRLVFGFSWERLASDYNIRKGGLMPIGVVVLMLAPLIAGRLRRVRNVTSGRSSVAG